MAEQQRRIDWKKASVWLAVFVAVIVLYWVARLMFLQTAIRHPGQFVLATAAGLAVVAVFARRKAQVPLLVAWAAPILATAVLAFSAASTPTKSEMLAAYERLVDSPEGTTMDAQWSVGGGFFTCFTDCKYVISGYAMDNGSDLNHTMLLSRASLESHGWNITDFRLGDEGREPRRPVREVGRIWAHHSGWDADLSVDAYYNRETGTTTISHYFTLDTH